MRRRLSQSIRLGAALALLLGWMLISPKSASADPAVPNCPTNNFEQTRAEKMKNDQTEAFGGNIIPGGSIVVADNEFDQNFTLCKLPDGTIRVNNFKEDLSVIYADAAANSPQTKWGLPAWPPCNAEENASGGFPICDEKNGMLRVNKVVTACANSWMRVLMHEFCSSPEVVSRMPVNPHPCDTDGDKWDICLSPEGNVMYKCFGYNQEFQAYYSRSVAQSISDRDEAFLADAWHGLQSILADVTPNKVYCLFDEKMMSIEKYHHNVLGMSVCPDDGPQFCPPKPSEPIPLDTENIATLGDGLSYFALMGCVAALLVSASMWALGIKGDNPSTALVGKKGVIVCLCASLIVGAAPSAVNWTIGYASEVDPYVAGEHQVPLKPIIYYNCIPFEGGAGFESPPREVVQKSFCWESVKGPQVKAVGIEQLSLERFGCYLARHLNLMGEDSFANFCRTSFVDFEEAV